MYCRIYWCLNPQEIKNKIDGIKNNVSQAQEGSEAKNGAKNKLGQKIAEGIKNIGKVFICGT